MGTLERIKQFIDSKGITNQKFEKEVGFSNGAFSSQLKNNRTIGVDKLENILKKYPELNPIWALTGNGDMLNMESLSEDNIVTYGEKDKKREIQNIPLYSITASASILELFSDHNRTIPIDYIRIPNLPKCDGAIYITGDSMYPLLKSGDMVFYKNILNKDNIIWGEMYVLYIDNDGDEYFFTKYLQKSERPGYVKCVSQNQHHQPVEFPIGSIKALAIVKASLRVNSQI
ncbi:Peptidase S24/S26A/S26B, conserved region [Pseudopedobacter saltans DSM 12145]|uniref:Peptidase S24/S26A/S26B, conserved region n=1 Tax=Pseudopedobacter saltans (strain ATCC 51119 / DSM 12145 / JCM 21818 / CCUG 39354 / LMG 10337 / NBRC 100064 / NCIMB 13643) TaxID=762903 RepID=F0SAV5_PSESL|nr:S24 family peptidase [Pseudopedobacter saltans]ADY51550.1 Peptidase S24/S26A/S26B, conserved region [Pseudopedobacter saltans DSM 12145]